MKGRFDPFLLRCQPEHLEAANFGVGEPLPRHVRERRSTPQRQGLGQPRHRDFRPSTCELGAALPSGVFEAVNVERAGLEGKHVTGRAGLEPMTPRAECPPQGRGMNMEGMRRCAWHAIAPHGLEQRRGVHRSASAYSQDGEQRPGTVAADGDESAITDDFHRTKQPHLGPLLGTSWWHGSIVGRHHWSP